MGWVRRVIDYDFTSQWVSDGKIKYKDVCKWGLKSAEYKKKCVVVLVYSLNIHCFCFKSTRWHYTENSSVAENSLQYEDNICRIQY